MNDFLNSELAGFVISPDFRNAVIQSLGRIGFERSLRRRQQSLGKRRKRMKLFDRYSQRSSDAYPRDMPVS